MLLMMRPPHHIVTRYGFASRRPPENSKTIALLMVKLLPPLCQSSSAGRVCWCWCWLQLFFISLVSLDSNSILFLYYIWPYMFRRRIPIYIPLYICWYINITTILAHNNIHSVCNRIFVNCVVCCMLYCHTTFLHGEGRGGVVIM